MGTFECASNEAVEKQESTASFEAVVHTMFTESEF
jgi:hypothetical protein